MRKRGGDGKYSISFSFLHFSAPTPPSPPLPPLSGTVYAVIYADKVDNTNPWT